MQQPQAGAVVTACARRHDIREHARVGDDFLKGFVVLESDVELDVYTGPEATGRSKRSM
jgi:hypothetical protein